MNALAPLVATVRRRPSIAMLVGVPLLAALLGALLAWALRGDGDRAPDRAAAGSAQAFVAGDLRLTLPDGWRQVRTGPSVPGFDKARTTYLSSLSSDVAIAMLPPTHPTLLPAELATRRDAAALRPRVLRAGRIRAYHYVAPLGAQRVVDVYAVPTTRGTATVACASPVYELGECQAVVGALRLARGDFLPLSPESAFLEALPAAVARLNADRAVLRTRLAQASTPEAGARAATRLAATYQTAGRPLRPLLPPDGDARATVRLLDSLRAEHASLAVALGTRDAAAFDRLADTIRLHEDRLADQLRAWQRSLPR
jgi:hypothetical protein